MEKTTRELLEIMKNSKDYRSYLTELKEEFIPECMKIDRALNSMLADKKLKKADVIAKSGIENHYAYQIFAGKRIPTRDKVIMLCIGFSLDSETTMQLMRVTGYAPLYAKNERDNAILFALTKHLSLIELNDMLYELGLDILT